MTTSSALKSIPISSYPESAWRLVLGVSTDADGTMGAHSAYAKVPIVYRCVRLRAKAVQRIPIALMRGKTDVTDKAEYSLLLAQLAKLMYQFEASLCVYAAAYALKQKGRLSSVPSLRWITSAAITPKYDEQQGLSGFTRALGRTNQTLQPDELVYCWLPILDRDIGPGVAPVAVALRAAGVLNNLDIFLEGFFDRGALRVTLLTVEGNPAEREIQKLESWWRKVVSGVKNAFASVGVRANVKPVTIGDSLKDTVDATLNDAKTQQILEAMEVPASIALPGAANYATARQDWINFYEATIIPEAEQIIMPLNAWLRDMFGLTIELHPERLEVFQAAELEKAGALVSLVGPVLTQNEARAKLELEPIATDVQDDLLTSMRAKIELIKLAKDAGLDPLLIAPLVGLQLPAPLVDAPRESTPILGYHIEQGVVGRNEARAQLGLPEEDDTEDQKLRRLQSVLTVLQAAKNAGLPLEAALQLVGLEVQLPETQPAVIDGEPPADQIDRERERMRAIDLYRWECKAIKRGKPCSFESVWIAPDEQALIAERLKHLPIAQAFKIAPPGEGLDAREQRLYDALVKLLGGYERGVLASLTAGDRIDLDSLTPDLRAALVADLTQIALDVATEVAEGIGPDLDPAAASTAASEWARAHAGDLIQGVTEKTQAIVQQAVATYAETPGMTRAQLSAMLQGAFGARRAETIAITEATRAAAQGAALVQDHLATFGLTFVRVWRTVQQDVCPLCEPLDGQAEGDGWTEGPPAHPRCRCAITLKEVKAT